MERFDLFFALHVGERLIPTPIICLRIFRVLRWLLSVDNAWQMQQRRRSQKFALIQALTISMLTLPARVKACLANQRFQENDPLWPDWRFLLVHQAIPKLPKITLERSIMRLLILSSGLSISALTLLIRKASAFAPRWRPSWLKLLMVSAMRQRSVSWGIIQRRCWYEDSTCATKYFGSYVKGGENIMFWRNGVGGVKFPEPKKKLVQ